MSKPLTGVSVNLILMKSEPHKSSTSLHITGSESTFASNFASVWIREMGRSYSTNVGLSLF